jgi:hypothetical protein
VGRHGGGPRPRRAPQKTPPAGAPGKVSYGSYAVLMSLVTFGVWLMCISIALLIAGQLGWLLVAFLFESAFHMGVS